MALNWSFWNGLQINSGYCDFVCEFREKFHMDPVASLCMLLVILIICIGLIWWNRRELTCI